MVMSFEEANRIMGGESMEDENWELCKEAIMSFNLSFKFICKACIHRNECNVKCQGIDECNYFDRGE